MSVRMQLASTSGRGSLERGDIRLARHRRGTDSGPYERLGAIRRLPVYLGTAGLG